MNQKTIGLVLLARVAAVDVTGPAEAFAQTKIPLGNQSAGSESPPNGRSGPVTSIHRCYRVLTIGVREEQCVTECGIKIKPYSNLEEAPPLGTLLFAAAADLTIQDETENSPNG